jgi:hypothetical protein
MLIGATTKRAVEMAATIWDCSRRVIFERGIAFVRDGGWQCESMEAGTASPDLGAFAAQHNLSPILIELDDPSSAPIQIALPYTQGRPTFDSQVQGMWVKHNLPAIPFNEILSIAYTASALVYHVKRMAGEYNRIVRNYLSHSFPRTESDYVTFGFQPEPFFEFDALIAAGIRTLDVTRNALWRLAGERGSVPSSFRRTLDQCAKLKPEIKSKLESLWNSDCASAKEYRDCIQHYVSPGADKGFAAMKRFEPCVWGMRAWLPDNP